MGAHSPPTAPRFPAGSARRPAEPPCPEIKIQLERPPPTPVRLWCPPPSFNLPQRTPMRAPPLMSLSQGS